jgi:class 3 adenylate cyclase
VDATFCYVDLAGFTALAEAHGDETAADVAVRFVELVDSSLGEGDRLLKTVGDAVLVACPNPEAGVLFVSTLYELVAGEPGFPGVRAGLHHGNAAERDQEVLGRAVNLAARIAGAARRGQALATQAVAEAAVDCGVEVTKLGDHDLRGIPQPVTVYELDVRADQGDRVEDPVCRMEVERERAPARLRHEHVDYYFCSLECAAEFAQAPGRFAFD